VAVMLVCGLAVLCSAQEKAAPKTAMGTVKSLDTKAMTLVVTVTKKDKSTEDMTFTLTKDTKVTEGDAAKLLADLKEGVRVQVTFEAGTPNPVAKTIAIHAARTAPHAGK
jgi:uncharacterized lipoprotein YajG